jgi:cbb3-type cytochrome oxidase subunit 3
MGSTNFNPTSPHDDDESVLFLFIAFAILIVLLLILVLISCQTWMLWKMAKAVVEQDAQITRRGVYGGSASGFGYGSSEGKRRNVRGGVYAEDDEEGKLMSGGNGGSGTEGKKRKGVWGVGRWV